jgi:hypothetical protein
MARHRSYFDVRPRYAGGSPAMVPQETAIRVAAQEKEAYAAHLEGVYGEADQKQAQRMGLSWIVFEWWEQGKTLVRVDLITGDRLQIRINETMYDPCPIYSNDMPKFTELTRQLRLNDIKFDLWEGQRKDEADRGDYFRASYQWIVVRSDDREQALKVMEWMGGDMMPMPPYFSRIKAEVA